MHKKRERLNYSNDFLKELIAREKDAAQNGKWLEAISIQIFTIEMGLRLNVRSEILLRMTVKNLADLHHYANYWNEEKFVRLASNYLLLGGEKDFVAELLDYSKRRGKLIHEIDVFQNMVDLDKSAHELYEFGDGLLKKVIDNLNSVNERLQVLKAKLLT